MADEIPLAYDKTTAGTPVGLKEVAPGNQLGNQWLAMPPGYIDGLILEWVSGSSIRITSGACSIPAVATLTFASAVTKSGIALGASTWGHIYAYLNAGTADFEVVTTGPSAPYNGKARNKNGDTSRRYIGSVLTDASGNIHRFIMGADGTFSYTNPGGSTIPFRVLSNKQMAAEVAVSLASVLPVTADSVVVRQFFNRTVAGNASQIGALSGNYMNNVSSPGVAFLTVPLASLTIYAVLNADITDGNGGLFVDVQGYIFSR
ncbi:hypothetical protein [Xanthomonas sp. BRIP62409]|uniref:hypothetical protein n=1 Tax=Xanthomonas sp. BRIP62409 TaxID=2182388 RepID=UPI000F8F7C7B|nr:hypothetical protein [Xanthomonas sp. BRIP62409]